MSTCSPSPAGAPETASPVAAVVEWAGQDGQPCYLSDSGPNPVTLAIDLDRTSKTALLKIRIQLELRKPVSGKTSLCLYIPPGRIHSAALDSSELPTESKRLEGLKRLCLRLELTKAADLVARDWPLRPNNKVHGAVLDSTQILAQQTSLSLHVPDTVLDKAQLDWLCDSLRRHELHSGEPAAEGDGVYEGQDGRIISPQLFAPRQGDTAQGLPSYEELEGPPPPPPIVPPGQGKTDQPPSMNVLVLMRVQSPSLLPVPRRESSAVPPPRGLKLASLREFAAKSSRSSWDRWRPA